MMALDTLAPWLLLAGFALIQLGREVRRDFRRWRR